MSLESPSTDALADLLTAAPAKRVERVLRTARELLDMEIAYYTQLIEDSQTLRAVDGDPSFGFAPGTTVRLSDSYCQQMLDGRIPNAVGDTRAVPSLAELPATEESDLAAYIGVPITLPDGRTWGTLCCASHRAREDAGDREVRFLEVLARILADDIALSELRETVEEQADRLLRTRQALVLHERVAEQLAIVKYSLAAGRHDDAASCLDAALANVQRMSADLLPGDPEPGLLRAQPSAG